MGKIIGIPIGCCMAGADVAQDITLRHDLDGRALDTLATLVLRFNDGLKGKGRVLLQDVRGVEHNRCCRIWHCSIPTTAWIFLITRPRFRPLYEVMGEAGQRLDAAHFYPQVADAVDDAGGRIQALPLALTLPVLLTNRTALRRAGVDPDQPVWSSTWRRHWVRSQEYSAARRMPFSRPDAIPSRSTASESGWGHTLTDTPSRQVLKT